MYVWINNYISLQFGDIINFPVTRVFFLFFFTRASLFALCCFRSATNYRHSRFTIELIRYNPDRVI